MLKSLVECQLPSKFILIEDNEEEAGEDLLISFLKNHADNETINKINLICYENSPDFYLQKNICKDKITSYHVNDIDGWNKGKESQLIWDLIFSNPENLTNTVFFIDSLSFLIKYHGFYTSYKYLSNLKTNSKKVIGLAHGDLFSLLQLEELKSLSTAFLKFHNCDGKDKNIERKVDVLFKKPGGKVINQEEIISVDTNFKVFSVVKSSNSSRKTPNITGIVNNLTTFKLGINMNENERKAKNELILPYIRTENKSGGSGEIIYHQEAEDDLEDDPDDDLDI